MDLTPTHLQHALVALGDLLDEREQPYDLVVIRAGAMVLGGHTQRATEDLDVVGLWRGQHVVGKKPLPPPLHAAVEDVGRALGLSVAADGADRDWLNPGPAMLAQLGSLPPGFATRLTVTTFGALTVRLAARIDLIHLKLLAATDIHRPTRRRASDLSDLKALAPTRAEALQAARWVAARDGRPDAFELDIQPILVALGHPTEPHHD